MLGKEDEPTFVTFTLTDKLLYEKSSVAKFLRTKMLSRCIDPLNLFEESWRIESAPSWNINVGNDPERRLLLK